MTRILKPQKVQSSQCVCTFHSKPGGI